VKELFVVSTLYQCVSLAAAIDGAALPETDNERILVLTNNAMIPEITVPFHEAPGFTEAASRFDRVVDLSSLLWPRRPGQLSPREQDLDLWEKLLRSEWELGGGPVHLYVESIQVDPAIALARIFPSARVSVHSDGLMSYGPTRNPVPLAVAQRLDSLLYVDLVPGLRPQLLREHGPKLVPVDPASLRRAMEELNRSLPPLALPAADHLVAGAGTALLLGQYLADLGILSAEEEVTLHRRMIETAKARGIRHCVFKPHPSAGPGAVRSIEASARELGMQLDILESSAPAEVVMQRLKPQLVVSCFSTALMTAKYLFNFDAAAVGTTLLLERLSPYENSNRVPVTIIDAVLERDVQAPDQEGADTPAARRLQPLVEAVSYCMQPDTLALARPGAENYLLSIKDGPEMRYFKRRRLTKLQLPGGLPPAFGARPLAKVERMGRRAVRKLKSAVAS
jgi:hypothetical protein